ncbi:hypothetical protein [Ornithinimicrobium cerasi]|uniref:Uncharacterized protein n=1 Tax=Ornithinimicrobium cerasi TaxID=2248773 RepID=A0A285VAJ2_9MICO|nr:hypothetical protein [Ornithinimicrobium cerasi]SOC51135.1 hypothetical protein SAMN05421879_10142 [Ornithinimicrobium cerasi]
MDGTDGLFYIDGEDRLTTMVVTPYEAEDVLQALLSRHPDLLAGGQMDPHNPRRWLLVGREHGVPDRGGASSDRWSLDHLCVDQDAVPTLIEVKRSTDTRIRREVVGQMLDYAANGVLFWPVDRLREEFTTTQRAAGVDPVDAVRELTGDDGHDVESFFDVVFENLQAGRVRLVFVADLIPDELQRIVEFLNTQMSPAQVFAVEVKQYAARGFQGRTIVPRLIGRTASTMTKTGSQALSAQQYREQAAPATTQVADRLTAWAAERGLTVHDTAQARQFRRPDGSGLSEVYFSYGTLDVDLVTARERMGPDEVAEVRNRLQRLTTKTLTRKRPSVPCQDVLHAWPTALAVLEELLGGHGDTSIDGQDSDHVIGIAALDTSRESMTR